MSDQPNPTQSLHLDQRQRAMLQAMGVTHWWPENPPIEAQNAPANHAKNVADNAFKASDSGQFNANISSRRHPPPHSGPPAPTQQPARLPTMAQADTGPVAEMDWDTLTDTIAQCRACGLCESRHLAVPGTGPRQARWLVVGEAPGEPEDQQGLPFVGPAGQLLDAMLAAMGLTRETDVYIANVIKCRPPHNRNPEPAEVAQCLPYLRRQMTLIQPDMVLALGKFAAQALLQGVVPDVEKVPLGKLRGPVYTVAGIPVLVTYHPAYLLRHPSDKAKAWDDLCLAMAHVGHNPLAAAPAASAPAAPP